MGTALSQDMKVHDVENDEIRGRHVEHSRL